MGQQRATGAPIRRKGRIFADENLKKRKKKHPKSIRIITGSTVVLCFYGMAVNQIKVFHRDHAFIALLSHYPLLREKLVMIKNFPGLNEHQKIDIQKFMTALSRMEEAVEKCQLGSGNATLDVAKYNKNLAEHADLLQDVMTIIKTSSTE